MVRPVSNCGLIYALRGAVRRSARYACAELPGTRGEDIWGAVCCDEALAISGKILALLDCVRFQRMAPRLPFCFVDGGGADGDCSPSGKGGEQQRGSIEERVVRNRGIRACCPRRFGDNSVDQPCVASPNQDGGGFPIGACRRPRRPGRRRTTPEASVCYTIESAYSTKAQRVAMRCISSTVLARLLSSCSVHTR